MPTYDYECSSCGHTYEKFQSITARPARKCPECGGRVRRLIGMGAGVIFKGSGFYETDYKRKKSAEPEKPEKAGDKTETGGKTDSDKSGKKPSKKSDQ